MGVVVIGAYQVLSSGSLMQQAAVDLQTVSSNVSEGRQDVALRNLELARDHASSARTRTRGPIVWLGSKLPWVGDDVSAVRAASEVMDQLANDSLPKLIEASRSLSPEALRPKRGRVDLEPIKAVEPLVTSVAADVLAARDRMATFEVAGLVDQLQGPMANLQRQLGKAAGLTQRGALAVQLLPPMLGDEEPRTYALITQNNAEIRSLGGITGAVAIVRARDGRVEMLRQGNEQDFGVWPRPVVDLTDEELALFGDRLAAYPQNAVMTPDFPRSAEILQAMWRKKHGKELDGVVSIDPVAMSYLLRATGPTVLPNGTKLEASKLVAGLENFVYILQPDYVLQDVYFAMVGRSIFDTVVEGQGDPDALLDELTKAVSERRVLVWSAKPEEQALLAGTPISGDVPRAASRTPDLAVYMNDASSDKMSFYLDYRVDVEPRTCHDDGSQTLDVTLSMRSTAPKNILEFADRLVFKGGYAGAPKLGSVRTTVLLYAPFAGRVLEATLEGADAPTSELTHLGRRVTSISLDLRPQQTRIVDFEIRTGPDQQGEVQLRTSPAAQGTGRGAVASSACS